MERQRVAAHGPDAQAKGIPTKGSGRVVGAIVVAAVLGFVYGFAPAVLEAVFGESEAHDLVISQEAVIAILLYVLGIILVPLGSAGVIGASRGSWRRSGLAVLIVTVAATITLGWSVGVGGAEEVDHVTVFIIAAVLASLGSLLGYAIGHDRQMLRERRRT